MKRSILFCLSLLITSWVSAQDVSNLDRFYDLVTTENLDTNRTAYVTRNGNLFTVKSFSYSGKEYTFLKFDITDLERVEWTTKEDYDAVYPENSETSSDAEHITLWFKKGTVARDNYFTSNDKKEYIGQYGETNLVSRCTNCDFVNIVFTSSELAEKAKTILDNYLNGLENK